MFHWQFWPEPPTFPKDSGLVSWTRNPSPTTADWDWEIWTEPPASNWSEPPASPKDSQNVSLPCVPQFWSEPPAFLEDSGLVSWTRNPSPLQQIESDEFGQNLWCPLRIQEIFHHHGTRNLIRRHEHKIHDFINAVTFNSEKTNIVTCHPEFHDHLPLYGLIQIETHNFYQSLRHSLRIQELFHEQEFHPQLQQIETDQSDKSSGIP